LERESASAEAGACGCAWVRDRPPARMSTTRWLAWPMFHNSWLLNETSANAGGLLRWPVKLLVPAGFLLISLQGISEIIKRKPVELAALLRTTKGLTAEDIEQLARDAQRVKDK